MMKSGWTDRSWNVVSGCTMPEEISECRNCFARYMAERLRKVGVRGYEDGFAPAQHTRRLSEPFKWPPTSRVLVCSMGDLFDQSVPDAFIDRVWAVMIRRPDIMFYVLTKNPERMEVYLHSGPALRWEEETALLSEGVEPDMRSPGLTNHIWVGVSAGVQATANRRVAILKRIWGYGKFVMLEPMLEPIDLIQCDAIKLFEDEGNGRAQLGTRWAEKKVQWLVAGGEFGPEARPLHPDWVREIADQCNQVQLPFYFKGWGEWLPDGQATTKTGADRRTEILYARQVPAGLRREEDHPRDGRHWYTRVWRGNSGGFIDGVEWVEFPEEYKVESVLGRPPRDPIGTGGVGGEDHAEAEPIRPYGEGVLPLGGLGEGRDQGDREGAGTPSGRDRPQPQGDSSADSL